MLKVGVTWSVLDPSEDLAWLPGSFNRLLSSSWGWVKQLRQAKLNQNLPKACNVSTPVKNMTITRPEI